MQNIKRGYSAWKYYRTTTNHSATRRRDWW